MRKIGRLWETILEEPHSEQGWYARRIYPEAIADIRVAILEPEKRPSILLEISASAIPLDADYPSDWFIVFPETIKPGPSGRVRLCLVLSEKIYLDVFEVLCEDVAGTAAGASSESGAVNVFLARLRVWQGFMKNYGPEGLGAEAQTGLFAELWFLQNALSRLPAIAVVQSWRGPTGAEQDFRFHCVSVEVKGATVIPVPPVQISSLAQLDESLPGHNLILCHILMNTRGQSGRTLPELVQLLRDELEKQDESALVLFNDHLISAGYLDIHAGSYENRHYDVRHIRYFKVTENFPRIRISEIRPGIVSGSYQIEFSACVPFEIPSGAALDIISGAGRHE